MGNCNQCQHFRKAKQPSQLLASVFTTNHAEVVQALNKIQDDEQKFRESEIDFKRAMASANQEYWPYRPITSDYCALKEQAEQLYLICEMKNPPPGICSDFDTTKRSLRSCNECIHKISTNGLARDFEREQQCVNMAASAAFVDASTDPANSLLDAQRKASAERKAYELTAAYHSRGTMSSRPEYLDYCGKLSLEGEGEYVICALNNPWHTCSDWQSSKSDSVGNDLNNYVHIPNSEITATLRPVTESDIKILVDTAPPLTQAIVNRLIATFEFILGVQIPNDTKPYLTECIVSNHQNNKDEIRNTLLFIESLQNFSDFDLMQYTSYLRDQSKFDKVCRILILFYDTHNQPVANGSIISQNMIDSMMEWMLFLNENLNNHKKGWPEITVNASSRSAFAQAIIQQLPDFSDDRIRLFVNTPLYCRHFKYHFNWNELRTDQWLEWCQVWMGWSNTAAQDAQFIELNSNNNIPSNKLPEQKFQSQELSEADRIFQQQMQLNQIQQEAVLRSNILKSFHETQMNIIKNF